MVQAEIECYSGEKGVVCLQCKMAAVNTSLFHDHIWCDLFAVQDSHGYCLQTMEKSNTKIYFCYRYYNCTTILNNTYRWITTGIAAFN